METDPIWGNRFFGRQEILEALEKRIQAFLKGYRQNTGLLGARSIGKSSILQHFLMNYRDPSLVSVYVEIQPEPFDYFAQKFMGSLLAGYLRSLGQDVSWEFNVLIKKTKKLIPKTLRKMRGIMKTLAANEWDRAFKDLLALTQDLHDETGKKILLILDNFDSLEELALVNPFHEFGNALMIQKDTLYWVTSSSVRRAQEIFRDKLAMLFGNFEVLEVPPFDFTACLSFLESRLPGVRVAEPVKKFFVELTDGHPYFLDILTERIRELVRDSKDPVLDEAVLIQSLEIELYERKGHLHQYFLGSLRACGRGRLLHASLKALLAVSLGYKKIQPISRYLRRTSEEVKKMMARLVEEELVEKKGSFFTISLPLLSFWMRYVYYRREFDFVGRFDLSLEAFRSEVNALVSRRIEEEKKEITKRVEELFRQFQNDLVEVQSKQIRCPHFGEVLFKPSNGRVFPVEARNPGARWLCQVAYKKVTEDDVRLFIQDIQKLRKKVHRRIMITLEGIELNAKLLAKEAKIMLWRLKDFNEILDLYNRPKVIL
jgi:AAA+ ATPase superfamily predicted ATPase